MKPKYVIIDTETTGLGHIARPPRPDAIVQVALAWRDPKSDLIESRSWLCNPGMSFLLNGRAKEALAIQGRTSYDIIQARDVASVADQVRSQLHKLGRPELRAYNRSFDEAFLSVDPWNLSSKAHPWGPCVMLAATPPCGVCDGLGETTSGHGCSACFSSGRERWPKLVAACERLKVPTGGLRAHDASGDAIMALLVQEALERGEKLAPVPDTKRTNVPVLTNAREEKGASRPGGA